MYVYIILSYTGSLPSKIIKKASRVEYSHVSLSLDDELTNMYSFGRKFLYFPWYGGFIQESVHDGLFKRMSMSRIAVYKIPINNNQKNKIEESINIFNDNKDNLYYDYIGLLGMTLGKDMFRDNGFVCSTFVGDVLSQSSYSLPKPTWLLRPIDFSELNDSELVYEGLALNYSKEAAYNYTLGV